MSDNLPKVSWIVAPEAYGEHPNWPANYGAWYVSQILDDGFFDHMVPPPPQSP